MMERAEGLRGAESDNWFYAYRGSETLWQHNPNWGSIDLLFANGLKIGRVDSSTNCYCTIKYYHLDALGSTRLVTDSNKAVMFSEGYQPYGQDNGTPTCSGTCETHRFTGKTWSSSVNLYYY